MARFVPNSKTRRWLVIVPGRALRPHEAREVEDPKEIIQKKGYAFRESCPFCLGNEKMTPPEIYRWGKDFPTDPHWLVRVIPNKYPITDIHEVIIHSADHKKDIATFSKNHLEILLKVYRERFQTLSKVGQVLIFNNKGKATGESLIHPHSQVVVVPKQISLDVLLLEPMKNIVFEKKHIVAFCPEFSQWPYEVWIARKACFAPGHRNGCSFGSTSSDKLSEIATLLQKTLKRLIKLFPDLSYNFYISPVGCWYLRIIPRLTLRAGFELGTGLHVNIVEPKQAAKDLRGKS